VDNLRVCCDGLGAEKALGEDGVTKAEYGKNLEENLRNLPVQLKRTLEPIYEIVFEDNI
jgi:hypothetical protein